MVCKVAFCEYVVFGLVEGCAPGGRLVWRMRLV